MPPRRSRTRPDFPDPGLCPVAGRRSTLILPRPLDSPPPPQAHLGGQLATSTTSAAIHRHANSKGKPPNSYSALADPTETLTRVPRTISSSRADPYPPSPYPRLLILRKATKPPSLVRRVPTFQQSRFTPCPLVDTPTRNSSSSSSLARECHARSRRWHGRQMSCLSTLWTPSESSPSSTNLWPWSEIRERKDAREEAKRVTSLLSDALPPRLPRSRFTRRGAVDQERASETQCGIMITFCFVKESAVQRTMCNFHFYFLSSMFPDLQQKIQLHVSRTMFEVIVSGDEDDMDAFSRVH
jgi:hypothetical protein